MSIEVKVAASALEKAHATCTRDSMHTARVRARPHESKEVGVSHTACCNANMHARTTRRRTLVSVLFSRTAYVHSGVLSGSGGGGAGGAGSGGRGGGVGGTALPGAAGAEGAGGAFRQAVPAIGLVRPHPSV